MDLEEYCNLARYMVCSSCQVRTNHTQTWVYNTYLGTYKQPPDRRAAPNASLVLGQLLRGRRIFTNFTYSQSVVLGHFYEEFRTDLYTGCGFPVQGLYRYVDF